ncbi:ankyrin repeat-containing domain protein [Xylariaceae sp. FL0662B]|nr:ankyrin repeat-containing domain protein [Xylariaceae sp. FL0662B]
MALLIKNGVGITLANINRRSLVHAACRWENRELIRVLLENGADAEATDEYMQTPLLLSAVLGRPDAVEELLAHGANANAKDIYRRTPLMWAARLGFVSIVRLLLSQRSVDPNVRDNQGRTALSWAAGKGRGEVVKLLLENERVDKNSRDKRGLTSPMWAAWKSHHNIVQLLVWHGCQLHGTDKDLVVFQAAICMRDKGFKAVTEVLGFRDGDDGFLGLTAVFQD